MNKKSKINMSSSIIELKGVGEIRYKLFKKLKINSVEDLINYYPRDYQDRSNIKKINELEINETCTFIGKILSRPTEIKTKNRYNILKIIAGDETGKVELIWFNQAYLKNKLISGQEYYCYGKLQQNSTAYFMQNADIAIKDDINKSEKFCILPCYRTTEGLTQTILRNVIKNTLNDVIEEVIDIFPDKILNKFDLCNKKDALLNIHFPKSEIAKARAHHRMVFEELVVLQLVLLKIKNRFERLENGYVFEKGEDEIKKFLNKLSFKLTDAQIRVWNEVDNDMNDSKVMNRLVQGDVGSGKTIIAMLAMLKAYYNCKQAVLMVPTEVLAKQHFITFSNFLKNTDINISLLVGGQGKRERKDVLEELKNGNINFIIGTHAIIEENVEFKDLGLVITDEQHRFGVRQRTILSKKGNNPDLMVMSATPIPRTLGMILFGDLDISIIDQLPPGRKPIDTHLVNESYRHRIYEFIKKNVSEGYQVYIVCPAIEEDNEISVLSAIETYENISSHVFPDLKTGLLHGKMSSREKNDVMKAFSEGKLNILVSTTVIEVGVDVPNATLMIIENAERFGLAQIHQLRGRVGRGQQKSYCILVNQSKSEISRERLEIVKNYTDGFKIAEKDLELRGPGDFFGTKQHGLPELRLANLLSDISVLKVVQGFAEEIIEDNSLELDSEFKELNKYIENNRTLDLSTI